MTIRRVALGSVAEKVDYGLTASATERNTGTKFLRITDIQNDDVDWLEVPYCDCTPEEALQHQLRAGDIVFARTGATTGKSHLIDEFPDGAAFASYLIRVRPKSDVLNPAFLSYFFRTSDYWQQVSGSAVGAAQLGFNATKLKQLVVPLPSLPEQQRIAEVLSKADRLRRLRRTARELSDTYLQSVFLEMFGDPVSNPRGWEETAIQEIAAKVTDGEHTTPERTPTGIKLLSARNIQNGYLDFEAGLDYIPQYEYERIRRRCNPEFGDILMSCSGTVGRVTTVDITEPFSMVRSVALIKLDRTRIHPKYFEHYLRSEHCQRLIARSVNQSSQANIFITPIKELPVLVPPLSEQREFAHIVHKFERLRVQQREAERQAGHLFQTLLHRAFQGEL